MVAAKGKLLGMKSPNIPLFKPGSGMRLQTPELFVPIPVKLVFKLIYCGRMICLVMCNKVNFEF